MLSSSVDIIYKYKCIIKYVYMPCTGSVCYIEHLKDEHQVNLRLQERKYSKRKEIHSSLKLKI